MRTKPSIISALMAVFALATSGAGFARAALSSSTPAANTVTSSVKGLKLSFSEHIDEKQSGVEIVMTAMPGMANHQAMKIAGFKTALGADGKTLTVSLPRALPAGTYKLTWHAVSDDGQRAEGSYSFSAK
jgi:copper resistance protein C